MDRNIFRGDDHHHFRRSFRRFVELEVKPHQEAGWAAAGGRGPRGRWRKASAEAGFLCPCARDRARAARRATSCTPTIVIEELAAAYEGGFALSLHSDIVVPYLVEFGTEAQKARWLPGCVSGEAITAIEE